jgi:hypothetical protein
LTWNTITSLQNLLPTTGYDFADCKNDANATRIKYWISNSFDENIVFAASGDGLFRSADKGINWIRVNTISGESKGTFIDYSTSPHTVYHANETGIYQSIDAGLTFSLYHSDNIRRFSGGRDATGLTLVYIDDDESACNTTYTNRYGNANLDCGYVWKETDGNGFSATSQMAGDWIRMAENNSQTVYITGARVWNLSYGTQVWVSQDAASSFNQTFQHLLTVINPWSPWPASSFDRSAIGLVD